MEGEVEQYSLPIDYAHLPATIVSMRVSRGQSIQPGTIVALYEYTQSVEADVEDDVHDSWGNGKVLEPRKVVEFRKMRGEVRSRHAGTVKQLARVGEEIKSPDQPVAVLRYCAHGIQLGGMCAICGDEVPVNETAQATVPITHDASGLTVSEEIARSVEKENADRLLKVRKLSLILDLDQTIIHATVNPGVGQIMDDPNQPQFQDVRRFVLPDSNGTYYYIKLRPHTIHFLQQVTQKYELHIYTMGTRNYARQVAQEIDPDSRLFNERILSRDDSGSFAKKSLKRLFPCDHSMVVVVDDRADVWQYSPNLVKVRPYEFFSETGDINAPLGAQPHQQQQPQDQRIPQQQRQPQNSSPVEQENGVQSRIDSIPSPVDALSPTSETQIQEPTTDDSSSVADPANALPPPVNGPPPSQLSRPLNFTEETDDHLLKILGVLNEVHERFYRTLDAAGGAKDGRRVPGADCQGIVPELKRSVLRGCVLAFSGVIPLNTPDHTRHELWRLAEEFGAQCKTELDSQVTHLLAAKDGTGKVNKARNMRGVYIVSPKWLIQSAEKWERLHEADYLFNGTDSNEMFFRGQGRVGTPTTSGPDFGGTGIEDEVLTVDVPAGDVNVGLEEFNEGLKELDEWDEDEEGGEDDGGSSSEFEGLGKRKERDADEEFRAKKRRVGEGLEEEEEDGFEDVDGVVEEEEMERDDWVESDEEFNELEFELEHVDDEESGSQSLQQSDVESSTSTGNTLNDLFRERRLQRRLRTKSDRASSRFQGPIAMSNFVPCDSEKDSSGRVEFPLIDLTPASQDGVPVTEVVVVGGPQGNVEVQVGVVAGMDTDSGSVLGYAETERGMESEVVEIW
ncbi:hypothetical protein BJ742DRAFT_779771 [Cladochytrium replicatum]|nr:hypothetical protein BJ742DRAFT_779771 [Cladochytrium replicatum]